MAALRRADNFRRRMSGNNTDIEGLLEVWFTKLLKSFCDRIDEIYV